MIEYLKNHPIVTSIFCFCTVNAFAILSLGTSTNVAGVFLLANSLGAACSAGAFVAKAAMERRHRVAAARIADDVEADLLQGVTINRQSVLDAEASIYQGIEDEVKRAENIITSLQKIPFNFKIRGASDNLQKFAKLFISSEDKELFESALIDILTNALNNDDSELANFASKKLKNLEQGKDHIFINPKLRDNLALAFEEYKKLVRDIDNYSTTSQLQEADATSLLTQRQGDLQRQ